MVGLWLRISCGVWLRICVGWKNHHIDDRANSLKMLYRWSLSSLETLLVNILTHFYLVHVVGFILSKTTFLLYRFFTRYRFFIYFFSRLVHSPSQCCAYPQHSTGNTVVNFATLIWFSNLTRVYAEWDSKNTEHKYKWHKMKGLWKKSNIFRRRKWISKCLKGMKRILYESTWRL